MLFRNFQFRRRDPILALFFFSLNPFNSIWTYLNLFLGKKINRESSQSSLEPMSSQNSSQNDENLPRESSRDSIESIDSVEREEDAPKRMVPLSKREIKDENEIKAWFSLSLITRYLMSHNL